MTQAEYWQDLEQQLAPFGPAAYVTRVVVKDICESTLDQSDKAALRHALSQTPQVIGSTALVEQHEDQGAAIVATAVIETTSQAEALKTIATSLTKGFDAILWDPESVELKAAFLAPEQAMPLSVYDKGVLEGDAVENFPVATLIGPNPAGDVLVEMDAGEIYYMARAQYLA